MDRRDFLSGLTVALAPSVESSFQPLRAAPSAKIDAITFSLSDVELLDGPITRQRETNRRYLLKLEPDRLLSCFRREAGLDPKAPPYRGWESEGSALWGHILGFYLSGTGMMVQATGDPELSHRLDYITDELDAVQSAHDSGYLLAVPNGKKLFKDVAAGNFEITHAEPNYGWEINDVFEPTYTWNKITLGLYESYQATGNPKTRAVLIRAADWLGEEVLDRLTPQQIQKLLFCEHGSIHESMLRVYQLTGDQKYLRWARALCFERLLTPLASGNGEFLNSYHANCSIPVFTGFERIYQQTGEAQLHAAAVNFVNEVIDHRSWIIGGNSAREHFFPPAQFESALHEPAGPENCNSVNMLRLIEAVYTTQPDAHFMDHYERILWNHLLAAHDPDRGMIAYYTPMQPGSYRVYADEFDSMWCCVGTGLECPGKYGQMIYAHGRDRDSVDVNLFIASRLSWSEAGVVLQQDTSFPDSPSTTITILSGPSSPFSLRVRHPWWIPRGKMRLRVNGVAVSSASAPGEYAVTTRKWSKGDRLEVDLPMHLSVQMLPSSENYAAILYGPIVLSGALGRAGLTKQQFWQIASPAPDVILPEDQFPSIRVPVQEIIKHLEPVPGQSLTFKLANTATSTAADITLLPFYRNHYQRYAIYWKLEQSRMRA